MVHLRNLPEDIDMDDVMELGRPFGPVISALRIKETQVPHYLSAHLIYDGYFNFQMTSAVTDCISHSVL